MITGQSKQAQQILRELGIPLRQGRGVYQGVRVRCEMFRRVGRDTAGRPFVFYECGLAKGRATDAQSIARVLEQQEALLARGVSLSSYVIGGRVVSVVLSFGYGQGEASVLDSDALEANRRRLLGLAPELQTCASEGAGRL